MTHDLHFGYQWMDVAEDLNRKSNGWGSVSVPGGLDLATDGVTPVFFEARVSQQSLVDPSGGVLAPSIYSSSELQSFEINDSIEVGDWTYNIGVLISNDVLYGQGLAPNSSNPVTGLEVSPGTKYEMYEVDWSDMIQPRVSVNWDYSDKASVYVSLARYNPSASSLARAASWDRNLRSDLWVRWDADGDFIESESVDSSSGKWFPDGLKPRVTNEWMIGTTQDISSDLTLRAHVRHKKSYRFWEDTWNYVRSNYDGVPDGIPHEPYIPDAEFTAIRGEIGGSSYVTTALDGSITKYYEVSAEVDWNRDKWFLSGSYTWSHYYGNFDQDNSTIDNDYAAFIGSSYIADGYGRQLWDNKDGNLKGDRRHVLKVYGFYEFDWNARGGAYLVYQSGEPWETTDGTYYGYSPTESNSRYRFSEPAGSRTTGSHYQLDLNYTHNFTVFDEQNIQLRMDIFNVLDNQTGYNTQRWADHAQYGEPRSFFKPRRIQLAVKYQF